MIRLTADNTVWWRVNVPDRNDDGELVEQPVRFRYRIYTRKELKEKALARAHAGALATAEAMRKLVGRRTSEEIDAALADAEAAIARMGDDEEVAVQELRDRIVGWNPEDITDQAGQPVPFSEQLRDALINDEARYQALRRGLLEASRGARPKNSLPGPAGSPAEAQAGGENSYGARPARPN